jgi:uncharacterized membrane protein (DUF485 family)
MILAMVPGKTVSHLTLEAVAAARWRIAVSLTAVMMAIYFGFVLLIAFRKDLLGALIAPGLSLGILMGALVIVSAWVLTWIYVRWANTHYDSSVAGLRPQADVSSPSPTPAGKPASPPNP